MFCGVKKDREGADGPPESRTVMPPRLPTATGISWPFGRMTTDTESCPRCQLHMYLADWQCPHCGLVQDSDQRHAFFSRYYDRQSRARKQALIVFSVFIVTSTLLFHWLGWGL